LLLSAARSFLFNAVLGARVRARTWNVAVPGDVWMLSGSHSIFGPQAVDEDIIRRVADGDIAPTGPLFGSGDLRSAGEVAELERGVATAHEELVRGLAANDLRQERRSLVLRPQQIEFQSPDNVGIVVSFYLNKGSYATVVIREIFIT